MTECQQDYTVVTTTDRESSEFAIQEKLEFLREQLESCSQLVKSLYSKLDERQLYIQALEQELAQTNKEMCQALMSQHQEITQAKQIARQIGRKQTSVSESLAALLNSIYGCTISAKELEVEQATVKTATLPNMVNQQILANSKELKTHSQQLSSQSKELGFQFISKKAIFIKSQEEVSRLTKLPQQSENDPVLPPRLQKYKTSIEVNVTQLQKNLARTQELLSESENYVKLAKSKSAKTSSEKKFEKDDLCLA